MRKYSDIKVLECERQESKMQKKKITADFVNTNLGKLVHATGWSMDWQSRKTTTISLYITEI